MSVSHTFLAVYTFSLVLFYESINARTYILAFIELIMLKCS